MANTWPARFDFKGSAIHMHNPTAMVHLPPLPAVPGPVRRGLDAVDPVPEGMFCTAVSFWCRSYYEY